MCGAWDLRVLGLHCVRLSTDRVLTADSLLCSRYANNRAALGGILQALLLTKHMLFSASAKLLRLLLVQHET